MTATSGEMGLGGIMEKFLLVSVAIFLVLSTVFLVMIKDKIGRLIVLFHRIDKKVTPFGLHTVLYNQMLGYIEGLLVSQHITIETKRRSVIDVTHEDLRVGVEFQPEGIYLLLLEDEIKFPLSEDGFRGVKDRFRELLFSHLTPPS